MSRQNKVNKDSYTQAGRLTPDDIARERMQRRPAEEHIARHKRRMPPQRGGKASTDRRAAPAATRPRSAREE